MAHTATPDERKIKSQFDSLSKEAFFDVLLPKSADFDAAKALRDGAPEDLHRAPARRNLFFDERACITLILKTSADDADVRAVLPNLEITLSAHATDAVPQGSGNAASASGKHDLTSQTTPAADSIDMIPLGDATYVVWKPTLHLPRPRVRLQRPAVYFTVHLAVSMEALNSTRKYGKDYLTSLEPLPANVLEAMQFDPSMGSSNIYLSETRITKVVAPPGRLLDDAKPVRGASKRAFPIVPALFTRVKYSSLPDSVIASLHLETSQVISGVVTINNVSFAIPTADVNQLNTIQWPKESLAGDETVLLYKLKPILGSTPGTASTIAVQIGAAVLPEDGPRITLDIQWQAQVDLSRTSAKPIYKWSRPLSVSSGPPPSQSAVPATSRPMSTDGPSITTSGEHGITFNFWAPSTMPSRKDFRVHVQCINNSDRSRRFALQMVQPKWTKPRKVPEIPQPGVDPIPDKFNAPYIERHNAPQVFDINPDVRIGPLVPGACYETELRFWAATTGVLDLGSVKIVDLDTRQMVDVKELPDIVILDPHD